MPKQRTLSPQSVWDLPILQNAFEEAGVANSELHATKLLSYLIRNPVATWDDVPGLPKTAVACLESKFVKFTSSLLAIQRSTDGETMKLLLSLQDGLRIEVVVMKYDTQSICCEDESKMTGNIRSTLCVSSQVGCQMGCTFCATGTHLELFPNGILPAHTNQRTLYLAGTMGLVGNLTAGEIVEQLAYASQFTRIRNIVFMGMGEPLHNYVAVKACADALALKQ
jgi:adenine C2-methylase RlmN of 23S rRNA A2503 and tRNA A37